ncbi:MAG TPA: carbon-nitrogen hydrolase family protein [Thermomicrobiales bacterium]|nr:carbon-nitrogen hydrolase family protein [Thermomicrobiales bacterium]
MQAAVVQLHIENDVEQNLAKCEDLTRQAARAGADIVVLPEAIDYHGNKEGVAEIKTDIPGSVSDRFAALARELGIWLLAGSIHENIPGSDRTYNTSVLFDRSGNEVARYRKLHLYDVHIPGRVEALESATIAPGSDIVTADIEGRTAGLTICYDIRFPELYRELADRGAEIVFLPAAFTLFTGKDHWETLIRARAIENQCFMLASGQQGVDKEGKATYGRSMIVDPWGTVLATAQDGEGFAIATLDFDRLEKIRAELPSLANRRKEVFEAAVVS